MYYKYGLTIDKPKTWTAIFIALACTHEINIPWFTFWGSQCGKPRCESVDDLSTVGYSWEQILFLFLCNAFLRCYIIDNYRHICHICFFFHPTWNDFLNVFITWSYFGVGSPTEVMCAWTPSFVAGFPLYSPMIVAFVAQFSICFL